MHNSSRFKLFFALAWLSIASATATAQTAFGSVSVGSSVMSAVALTIPNTVTLGSISVVTEGAPGLDFTNAGSGTCNAGANYAAGQTCTVEVTFKPLYPGARYGQALLKDGSGNVIASGPLYGIGVGPQIAFGPGTAIAIDPTVNGISLDQPSGVAVDGAGNLFIADDRNKRVVEVPAGGGAATAFDPTANGEGLNYPRGAAVDGAGDLFISDLGFDRVVEVPAGGGAAIAIDPMVNGHGLNYPCGMAIDGAGDLFIADVDNARVIEVPAGGGAAIAIDPTVNGKGLVYPVTLALDSAGDLFIADLFANQVVEVPAGGGAAIAIAPSVNGESLNQPYGVAVDAAGNLFIADSGNSRLLEVPAGGGAVAVLNTAVNGQGLSGPVNIALDNAGDVFIADSGNNRVVEVQRSQPPLLSFAATQVGSFSSDSPQTVQVENIGNASLAFPIPSAGNNPSISANFTLNSSGTLACPLVTPTSTAPGMLVAGDACLLAISFEPASAGGVSGTLTLTDNSLNAAGPSSATQSISLIGDMPLASLSATGLSFGAQAVGTPSASQQVMLTNIGGASMAIASIGVTGVNASSFVFTSPCGTSLAAGANCIIEGHFTPAAAGALTAAITIADNAGGSPQTVTLAGTGVYPATVSVNTSSSSITTAQSLTVTVAVSGVSGNPTPTGSVTLTIGNYSSLPTALSSGSATIVVSPGSLTVGTDSIVAAYTPDSSSSSVYSAASGTSSVTVTAASTAIAPTTTTGVASAITANAATLAGTVNPNGADTHYWFLYGASSTLSGASQTASVDLGSIAAADSITANISGLSVGTMYYYQAVAENSAGTTSGSINSFTTTAPPYFSITGASLTVSPGATSGNTSTINVTPWFGFTGAVSLSCSIAPAAANDPATCSLQPASVTIGGTASQTAMLTVNTTAATALSRPLKLFWSSAGGAVLACILIFGIPARRRNWRTMLGALLLLIALAGGVFACGGGSGSSGSSGNGGSGGSPPNPGTTAGNYTVTVTGASGSSIATGSVALTVQ
jgi:sugar lactone lactonase YvrE